MSVQSNKVTLRKSLKVFEAAQKAAIESRLVETAKELLLDALSQRTGWLGFTGNLPTSYAAGVWDSTGKLVDIIFAEDVDGRYAIASILRPKIGNGEHVHSDEFGGPWEGRPRDVRGKVDIENGNGPALSRQFLQSFTPASYPAICICTGAEYSQYIEEHYSEGFAEVLRGNADKQNVAHIADKIMIHKIFTT